MSVYGTLIGFVRGREVEKLTLLDAEKTESEKKRDFTDDLVIL
jgi:hypothetical protein